MTSKINFDELKASISVVDVAAWLGIKLKQTGDTHRGDCPLCEQERSFTLTPNKGLWGCFKCQQRGSIIDIVATFRNVGLHQAGVMLHRQFIDGGTVNSTAPAERRPAVSTKKRQEEGKTANSPSNPSPPNVPLSTKLANVQSRLQYEHEYVQAMGLSPEVARAFGIGYCPSGIMRGRVVSPMYLNGEHVAYKGLATSEDQSPLMLFPSNLDELVAAADQDEQPQQDNAVHKFFRVAK